MKKKLSIYKIRNISGIKLRGASFLMHQVYDDEMTFKLVRAASSVSGLPVEVCLEEFGRHFLVYCQKNGYDQILRVLGSNLYDFLTNLDNLHDHLASIYPGMRAPSFRVTRHLELGVIGAGPEGAAGSQSGNRTDEQHKENASCSLSSGSMYLHYYSERAGLSPIVKGLVLAVAREFFQTDIQVTVESEPTASVKSAQQDKHVVLRIDRQPLSTGQTEGVTSPLGSEAATADLPTSSCISEKTIVEEQQLQAQNQQATTGTAKSLNYDSLSTNAHNSLVNNEIMMQAFPFHVIFDRQFKLVQVGHSLLRLTSRYWQEREISSSSSSSKTVLESTKKPPVKFNDLFLLVRPKIQLDFDAIADHTNQVFVVRTKEKVLNANRQPNGQQAVRRKQTQHDKQPLFKPSKPSCPGCPLSRVANLKQRQQRRGTLPSELQQNSSLSILEIETNKSQGEKTSGSIEEVDELQEGQVGELSEQASLRLKGQMIILLGGQLCLYLCSPRVDHLGQLMECGVRMSDFALHDRARELMLMSHTHKEDREAVKKLDQASNDLKKMDTKLRLENKRTEEVLHNIFPAKIATLLSHGHKVESESFDLVSCLYSDIIGFTKMCGSENVRPIDIVRLLNTMYLQFDNLTNIHQVFKVETIGDAYVVVGGLPEPAEDHADRCVKMGLDMVKVIGSVRSPADNQPIQMRIGIHSGPVMAGIVGIRVPRYSLFGNTTTLANQLETHGVAGKIHISDFTRKNLIRRDRFVIEDNPNEINGIPFVTYFVTNYLGDENETLKHERILEEELIKDFQLMGNAELELVDDEQASVSIPVSQDHHHLFNSENPPSSQSQLYTNTELSKSQPEDSQRRSDRPVVKTILSESLANFTGTSKSETSNENTPQILCDLEDDLKCISNELTSSIIAQALEQVGLTSYSISSKKESKAKAELSQKVCPLCQGCGSLDHSPQPGDVSSLSSSSFQIDEVTHRQTLIARQLLDFLLSQPPTVLPDNLQLLLEELQAERSKLHPDELYCSARRAKKTTTETAHLNSVMAGFGHVISSEIQRIKRMDTLKSQKIKRNRNQPDVPLPPPPPPPAHAQPASPAIVEESEDEDVKDAEEINEKDKREEKEEEEEEEEKKRGVRASLACIANDLLNTVSSASQQSRKKRFSFANPFSRLAKSPNSMRRRQDQNDPHPSATNSRQHQQRLSSSSRCSCLKSSESNQSFGGNSASSSSFQAHPSALSAPLSSKAN